MKHCSAVCDSGSRGRRQVCRAGAGTGGAPILREGQPWREIRSWWKFTRSVRWISGTVVAPVVLRYHGQLTVISWGPRKHPPLLCHMSYFYYMKDVHSWSCNHRPTHTKDFRDLPLIRIHYYPSPAAQTPPVMLSPPHMHYTDIPTKRSMTKR